MPELPEVETIRRDLAEVFVGRRVERVQIEGARTLRRHADAAGVPARMVGRRLEAVGRWGKYLLLRLDGDAMLVIHLGMSGQLLSAEASAPVGRHTHLTMTWDGGPQLRFVDPRTFGEVFLTSARGHVPSELAHLGFDPVVGWIGPTELGRRLAARRTRLKVLLMDQRFVAGIGNIYSDEILWAASLAHDRPADGLSVGETAALSDAMVTTLAEAICHRGSSLADEQYRDLFGRVGSFQGHHRVYGREGMPCGRCETPIVRRKAGGRSGFFCPLCQV